MDNQPPPEPLPLTPTENPGPNEVEEIRQLLADIPNRTEKGTILFTKDAAGYQPKRRLWRVLASGVIVLALAFIGINAYVRQQLSPASRGVSALTEFEVQPGWEASRVANELKRSGFIRNSRIFSFYLRRQNLDRSIGEGLYDLDPAMSAADIATTLSQGGRPRVIRVVIPEGFRLKDIAKTLTQAGFADEQTFLDLFQNPGDLAPGFLEDQGLEGYLFPASYEIPLKSTPQDIVRIFLNRFEQEITPEILAMLEEKAWTVPDWVTLASIVQTEAASSAEMPIITGVFLNRLDEGMPLQSDPTVAYGLGKNLPELSFPEGDFEQDHPWNTYLYNSLPQTPISNPGHDALQAILNPQRTDENDQPYFYFLHGNDEGEPVFRSNLNLDDHNRDVALYLR